MSISKTERAKEIEMQTYRVALTDGDSTRITAYYVTEDEVADKRAQALAQRVHSSEWVIVQVES